MERRLEKSISEGLKELKGANRPSFGQARAEYQGFIFGFVSRRIKPVEEAEDVAAEVFLEAYRCWHRCRGPVHLWMLGIARRKVADHYRRHRPVFQLRDAEQMTADAMSDFESELEVRQAFEILHALHPDERDALSLQILEGLSIEEIATVIGRSAPATNSLLQRARERVRRATGREGANR